MAYASVADMIDRFGEVELMRLTTPDGADMTGIDGDKVARALGEAGALLDTYLRKRYNVPLDIAPPEVRRAACILARFDLMSGDQREPTEQARLARKDVIDWLEGIAAGRVLLDLEEVAPGDNSYAQMTDRAAPFGGGDGGAW